MPKIQHYDKTCWLALMQYAIISTMISLQTSFLCKCLQLWWLFQKVVLNICISNAVLWTVTYRSQEPILFIDRNIHLYNLLFMSGKLIVDDKLSGQVVTTDNVKRSSMLLLGSMHSRLRCSILRWTCGEFLTTIAMWKLTYRKTSNRSQVLNTSRVSNTGGGLGQLF